MRRLAVFARAPVPGRAKTRLSPALPPASAADLYAALLSDTLAAGDASGAEARTVWWADEPASAGAAWSPAHQRGEGLGERLAHALAAELAHLGARVVLVGSDAPALTAAHLDEAFHALESHDLVLGPTVDGGYWSIGLRAPCPELFHDIPWSTREVLTRTLVRAHGAGLRVRTLATLDDLDTPQDVATLVGRLAGSEPACGPGLRAALAGLGFVPRA